ncbi:hypothetical protein [Pseudomonas gingeri]|uniref:hypothetical protein n=1 Tax=Pseudomonas gingeri TaxID=117681 RepID=UPI0015A29954|nr:hypothetical protein [Pseudomonas gingeri]NVZ64649.1 hypothetical protein [Pseudomonas gingeri]NVZ73992.1 hypothetical protein [Pseudomonas gingeri]NWA05060.1 hypothetical protein [Pseudomonas gingeri]NWA16343.1 hypothetical protein [Pseudomonas gingeri]NWA54773.1 hypothetical protein [Pseudomonas gingeri]
MRTPQKNLEAELQRAEVRSAANARAPKSGPQAIIDAPDIHNALPNRDDGQPNLIHKDELLANGVSISLPGWDNAAPDGDFPGEFFDSVTIFLNGVIFDEFILNGPVDPLFPIERTYTEDRFGNNGTNIFRYEVERWDAQKDISRDLTFTIDRVNPTGGSPADPVELPGWITEGTITPETLAANDDEVVLTIPPWADRKPYDIVKVYWSFFDTVPIATMELTSATGNVQIAIPADVIIDAGEGNKLITYTLEDRAGNVSQKTTHVTELLVLLHPRPENLRAPVVPLAPIDRDDANVPPQIEIAYDKAYPGDRLEIDFGGYVFFHDIPRLSPIYYVDLTWAALTSGGLLAPYTAVLRYRVHRGDYMTDWSPTLDVDVDLFVPGGDDETPGPVNPDLPIPVIESTVTGELNKLGPSDRDVDALVHFPVPSDVLAGHFVQVYWGTHEVFATPHEVTPAEVAGGTFTFDVPWDLIELEKNGLIPVYYEFSSSSNANRAQSNPQEVRVSIFELVDLALPTFRNAQNAIVSVLNCDDKPELGVRINILDPKNIRAGDKLFLNWVVWEPVSNGAPVEASRGEDIPLPIVTANHDIPGHPGEAYLVPYDPYISTVIVGRAVIFYRLESADELNGGRSGERRAILSRLNGDSSVCSA